MKPSVSPSAVPSTPMVVPMVRKIRSTDCRVAPIVRKIAMSRVRVRTSMISEETMLNAATSTMIDRMTNITTRSVASASNRLAFIRCQLVTTALPATCCAKGWRICSTLSGSVVLTSIMPTASPESSNVWASAIGMTT